MRQADDKNINTMDVNRKQFVKLFIDGVQLSALFDTGSDVSAVRSDVYENQLKKIELINSSIQISGVGGGRVETLGFFSKLVTVNDEDVTLDFHIIPAEALSYKAVVGNDLTKHFSVIIEDGENVILYKKSEISHMMQINLQECDAPSKLDIGTIEDLNFQIKVKKLIEDYVPKKTETVDIKMKITLKDEEPIYDRPRRLSPSERQIVDNQIQEWLEEGIIRKSCSDFASAIVLVKKKNGQTRLCCDYRKINKKIIKDRFPLPLIEDVLDRLQGAKYFTTLD